MPYHSEFLSKDETGLEAPDPLTFHYQRYLNLRVRISCSFARSYADHRRAFPSYFWIQQKRLIGEDGRLTCAVHVPATEVYDYAAAQRWTYFLGRKTLRLTSVLLILRSHQILHTE